MCIDFQTGKFFRPVVVLLHTQSVLVLWSLLLVVDIQKDSALEQVKGAIRCQARKKGRSDKCWPKLFVSI